MSDRFEAAESGPLLPALIEALAGWPRSKVKTRLKSGCVLVNGEPTTKHDHALNAGDQVEVLAKPKQERRREGGKLTILYEAQGLIAIDKPAGLLSVGSTEGDFHALAMLKEEISGPGRLHDVWPVHRLDRDTSGVLVFATTREAREAVTGAWSEAQKTYLAVVEGEPNPAERTIEQPLRMDSKGFRALVGPHPDARRAVTHFRVQRSANGRSLLEVRIDTGRQHQIRAHLSCIGHPLVGDDRYGTKDRRLGLHAHRLSFPAPNGRGRIELETPPPRDFLALMAPRDP